MGGAVSALRAQAPATDAKPLAFEVAAIKQNKSGPGSFQGGTLAPGDRVRFTNVPLRILIQEAYGVSEIIGGPNWIGKEGPNFDADRFDVVATVMGGGMSGQAGAIRHGIARALVKYDEQDGSGEDSGSGEAGGALSLRKILRQAGHLTHKVPHPP